ncbi:MAG: C45 family peptidase [Myxococcota bacterium]
MARIIELGGDDASIGAQYGEQARPEIHAVVDYYETLFTGLPEAVGDALRRHAEKLTERIHTLTPHLARQIEATADAAGVDRAALFRVNARSELFAFAIPECTAIYSPASAHLAQNWDFGPDLLERTVLLRIELEDGRRLMTLTEAGMLGKIGLNADGIGVCLNMLVSNARVDGLPIHVLLRWLLEARSREEVETRLKTVGHGRIGNVLIGSTEGWGINMEFGGASFRRDDVHDRNFVHTNHLLEATASEVDFVHNSIMRFDQAHAQSGPDRGLDFGALDAILSDRSNAEHPIHVPVRTLGGMTFGTLYTVIMDLPARTLHLRKGQDPAVAYETHAVVGPPPASSGVA